MPELPDSVILDEAWGSVHLHGDWKWLSKNMSTPQRELVADAITRWHERLHADDPDIGGMNQTDLRWWRYDPDVVGKASLGRPCLCKDTLDHNVTSLADVGQKLQRFICGGCRAEFVEAV